MGEKGKGEDHMKVVRFADTMKANREANCYCRCTGVEETMEDWYPSHVPTPR